MNEKKVYERNSNTCWNKPAINRIDASIYL